MLLSAGEDPMWVSHQMGHADWGMIRKTYGRWIPDMNPIAGRKVEDLWSQHGQKSNNYL
jgi:integrase